MVTDEAPDFSQICSCSAVCMRSSDILEPVVAALDRLLPALVSASVKRQIYYGDILLRPKTFRSRAEEKDETDRIGHLPLEPHYPSQVSPANLNQDHFIPAENPYKPEKPHLAHANEPTKFFYDEPFLKPKPSFEKPRPVYSQSPEYSPKPVYEESFHPGKIKGKKENKIPGIPGEDYPVYREVPQTDFSCHDVPFRPGMYANPEARCQVYHVCHDDRHGPQGASFLCTNGTIFNQKTFSCDWWYNVDCAATLHYYELNNDPAYNPYSQKPYEEKDQEYKITDKSVSFGHLQEHNIKYRENIPVPHKQSTEFSTVTHGIKPSYEPNTSIRKARPFRNIQKPAAAVDKFPFNAEAIRSSFFKPDNDKPLHHGGAFSTRHKTKVPYTAATKDSTIHPRTFSGILSAAEVKETVDTDNNFAVKAFSSSKFKERANIQKPEYFPRSKDIYSRIASTKTNDYEPKSTRDRQPTENNNPNSNVQPLSTDHEQFRSFYPEDFDLHAEWGKKIAE